MKHILKLVTLITLSLATWTLAPAPSLPGDDGGSVPVGGVCCSNHCGDDNECYRWCVKAGSSGPCPDGRAQ